MTTNVGAAKSAEAFRTISEVAEVLKLPQHVLRFWETRFTQIKPLKRAGGRRFYRPEDVELLVAIRQLLYADGYTIKGVQRILREQGSRAVAALARQPATVGLGEDSAARDTWPEESAPDDGPPATAPAPVSPGEMPGSAPIQTHPADALREALATIEACRALLEAAAS